MSNKQAVQTIEPPGHYDHDELGGAELVQSTTVMAVLNRSEVESAIAAAAARPRRLQLCLDEINDLATRSLAIAQSCIYALPRAGKTIEGASIRYAEMLNYSWRNTRVATQVVGVEDEDVRVAGYCYDLERNIATRSEVMRRITDRDGKRYNHDMIVTTSNAAMSIARRNAILHCIPKALWNDSYQAARKVVAGDVKTLANRADAMMKEFAIFGVKPEQIYGVLGVNGYAEITTDHIVFMGGIHTAIKEGTITAEKAFAPENFKTPGGGARPQRSDFVKPEKEKAKAKKADDKKPDGEKQKDDASSKQSAKAETQSTETQKAPAQVNQSPAGEGKNRQSSPAASDGAAPAGPPEPVMFPAPPKVDDGWWKETLENLYAFARLNSLSEVRADLTKQLAGNDEAVKLINQACDIQTKRIEAQAKAAKK